VGKCGQYSMGGYLYERLITYFLEVIGLLGGKMWRGEGEDWRGEV